MESTPSYAELTSETATKIVDAIADLAHRSIRSSRSLWEIASAPYGTNDAKTIVSATFERAAAAAQLGAGEAKAQIDATQRFGEMTVAQTMKFQDAYLNSLRIVLDVGFSNLTFVREVTALSEPDRSQRFDVYTTPAGAGLSTN